MSARNSAKGLVIHNGKLLVNKCISRFGEYYALPGGGQHTGEMLGETVKRELLEETGCVAEEWEHLLTVPSNATVADNLAHIFRARNCKKVAEQHLDSTEYLNVCRISEDELAEMVAGGRFEQAMHIMAWLYAKQA